MKFTRELGLSMTLFTLTAQYHTVSFGEVLSNFIVNFPAKKLCEIVVVRLIYVICTKDGGGGALAHTYYSVAAWPVQKNGRSADKRRKVFLPPSVLEPFFYTTLYYQTLHTVSFNEVLQNWGFKIKIGSKGKPRFDSN